MKKAQTATMIRISMFCMFYTSLVLGKAKNKAKKNNTITQG
jgi:hypothetical protein